jgi:hypothetical protein
MEITHYALLPTLLIARPLALLTLFGVRLLAPCFSKTPI